MTYPYWWASGVRVVDTLGSHGQLERAGTGWVIRLDKGAEGEDDYLTDPPPDAWRPEVRQLISGHQRDRIVHDAERALLRAFGCHYVPEFEALPERMRVGAVPRPRAVGRPELDGLQNIIRGAVMAALTPYTRDL